MLRQSLPTRKKEVSQSESGPKKKEPIRREKAVSGQIYLHHQTLLLLRALPPKLGELVDLRVQELVLGLVGLHVVLTPDTNTEPEPASGVVPEPVHVF